MRCVVIYPFFALYRRPVMDVLLQCKQIDFSLAGGLNDCFQSKTPIKTWIPSDTKKFTHVKSRVFLKYFLFQFGIIRPSFISQFDAFIVLGDYKFITSWFLLIVAKILKKPVYLWTHGWTNSNESRIAGYFRNMFYRLSSGLLLYGDRAKAISKKNGFKDSFSTVIYNSLDYALQKVFRSRLSWDDRHTFLKGRFDNQDRAVIFIMGRITAKMELLVFFESLKYIHKPTNVIILGSGDNIPLQIGDHSICHIEESFSEDMLSQAFNAADLFVYPGFVGLSAIHALAYGVPVITRNPEMGGMPESEAIIDGITGAFYESGSAIDLANKISSFLLKGRRSGELASKCVEVIERCYTPEIQVNLIVKRLYEDLNDR